jgi:hypothetical protein
MEMISGSYGNLVSMRHGVRGWMGKVEEMRYAQMMLGISSLFKQQ